MFHSSARVGSVTGQQLVDETIRFIEETKKNDSSLVAVVGGIGEFSLLSPYETS